MLTRTKERLTFIITSNRGQIEGLLRRREDLQQKLEMLTRGKELLILILYETGGRLLFLLASVSCNSICLPSCRCNEGIGGMKNIRKGLVPMSIQSP
jgi:hypothetical protein